LKLLSRIGILTTILSLLFSLTNLVRIDTFTRLLDFVVISYLLYLFVNKKIITKKRIDIIFILFFTIFLFIYSLLCVYYFNLEFFLVEFRYLFFFLILLLTGFEIEVDYISKKSYTLFFLVYSFSLITLLFYKRYILGEEFRNGIFGECNYDFPLLISFYILYQNKYLLISSKLFIILFFFLVFILNSKTGYLSTILFIIFTQKKKSILIILFFTLFIIFSEGIDFINKFILFIRTSDRFVFYETFINIEKAFDYFQIIFGTIATNTKIPVPTILQWYSQNSFHSKNLEILTPSLFHGQFERLMFGFGLLGVILIYVILLYNTFKLDPNSKIFLLSFFIIASFTQSFLSHPYTSFYLFYILFNIHKYSINVSKQDYVYNSR
jgi:hypothetical protein